MPSHNLKLDFTNDKNLNLIDKTITYYHNVS